MAARILIAEDHPASRELLVYLLEMAGHEVRWVDDGIAAVQAARDYSPDLIVCDVQMPGMDGYGVLRALRDDVRLAAIPVLAVTAYSMPGDRERVIAAGFNAYFAKPIDPETFVADLAAHLPPHLRGMNAATP
ncbi:MAG: response regulator [Rhodocyclaceae bacterium]|nr:response regulator [Rhodocyclaceae bacterium]MBX3669128.1 response regulator [Rhodocyclaceae bacterium]